MLLQKMIIHLDFFSLELLENVKTIWKKKNQNKKLEAEKKCS